MAHSSQLGYGAAPNSPYRQQQNQYSIPERPHTAGSGRNPQYQNPGRAQTPLEGFRNGNDSNEVSGRRDGRGNGGWSEDRIGREQSGISPYAQTFAETRRDPTSSHHAVRATPPYHVSPVSQFKEPQFDRYQYQEQVHLPSRHGVIPHQDLPTEPVFDYEPSETDANSYNMRNNQINPRARPLAKPSVASENIVDYQRGGPVIPPQQQDYAELYRQESFQGKDGPTSSGFGTDFSQARVGDGRAQIQYSGPQQGRGKPPS